MQTFWGTGTPTKNIPRHGNTFAAESSTWFFWNNPHYRNLSGFELSVRRRILKSARSEKSATITLTVTGMRTMLIITVAS